jgi:hypothetical protein
MDNGEVDCRGGGVTAEAIAGSQTMSEPDSKYLEQLKGFVKEAAKTAVTTQVQTLIPPPIRVAMAAVAIVKEMPVQYRKEGGGPAGLLAAARALDPIKQAGEADRKAEQAARVGDHEEAGAQRFKELEALGRAVVVLATLPRRLPVPEIPAAPAPKPLPPAEVPKLPPVAPGGELPAAAAPKLPPPAEAPKLPPVAPEAKLPAAPVPKPLPPAGASKLPALAPEAKLPAATAVGLAAANAVSPTPPLATVPNVPAPAPIQKAPSPAVGEADPLPADVNGFIQAMIRDEALEHTKAHFLNRAASQTSDMIKANVINNKNLMVAVSAGVVDGKLRYVVTVSHPKIWQALKAAIDRGESPLPPGLNLGPPPTMDGKKLHQEWHVESEGPAELLRQGAKGVFTGTSGAACKDHCEPFWIGELGAPPQTVIHTHIEKFAPKKGDAKTPGPPGAPDTAKVPSTAAPAGKDGSVDGAKAAGQPPAAAAPAQKPDAKVPSTPPAAKASPAAAPAGKVPSATGATPTGKVPSAAAAAATAAGKKESASTTTKASSPAPTVPKAATPATISIVRDWR